MKRTGFVQYKCSKCLSVYPSKHLLDLHDYYHTGRISVALVSSKCPECEFTGTSFPDLIQHVPWHVLGKKQKTACLLCDYRTRSLKRHMHIAHPTEIQQISEKWGFECLECQEKYLKKCLLHRHIDEVHKGHLCLCCGARVQGAAAFFQHVEEHRTDGAFRCRLCGRSCEEYRELHRHFGEEHREDVRVRCRLCQTEWRTAENLAIHMKQRHNLDECGKDKEADNRLPVSDIHVDAADVLPETSQAVPNSVLVQFSADEAGTDADASMNDVATEEEARAGTTGCSIPIDTVLKKKRKRKKQVNKPCKRKCQLCDGEFYDLKQHIRDSHPDCQDANPYACVHCAKRFRSLGCLRVHARYQAHPLPAKVIPAAALEETIEHIRTTGTFSYYCWKCRINYPTKTLLLLHEFMHVAEGMEEHSQRTCPECGYTAASFNELVSHVPQHAFKPHDQKQCLLCGDSFAGLKSHVRHGHSELMKRISRHSADSLRFQIKYKEVSLKLSRRLYGHISRTGCFYCKGICFCEPGLYCRYPRFTIGCLQ